ncbi:MAG: hypothetical protein AAGI46_02825 [Planctomycetota bacterium]
MAHTCNIDAKGRLFRGVLGLIACVVAAFIAIVWAVPAGSVVAWVLVAGAAGFGLFGLYEAYHGWCAAKALGFKTPF